MLCSLRLHGRTHQFLEAGRHGRNKPWFFEFRLTEGPANLADGIRAKTPSKLNLAETGGPCSKLHPASQRARRMKNALFDTAYPSLSRWVKEFGQLEIGYDPMTASFIRAVHPGGDLWKGRRSYKSLDAALEDAEVGVARLIGLFE